MIAKGAKVFLICVCLSAHSFFVLLPSGSPSVFWGRVTDLGWPPNFTFLNFWLKLVWLGLGESWGEGGPEPEDEG